MLNRLLFLFLAITIATSHAVAQSLTVSTLAGDVREGGSADGIRLAARFNNPQSLAVSAAGTVFIIDTGNYTIRAVTAAGVVTTIAGSTGARAYLDGTGPAARFFQPRALVCDSAGNSFLLDLDLARGAATVRKVTPAGVVSTFLHNAFGASNLAIDAYGSLLVSGLTVSAYASNSAPILPPPYLVPGGAPRPPTGNFGRITAWTCDRLGNIYLTDVSRSEIRKVSAGGVMTVLAGTANVAGYADGTGTAARFNGPTSIAVDSQGNVFVGDGNNGVLRRITPTGIVTTVLGANGQPKIFDAGGRLLFPDGAGANARLLGPAAIAIGPDDSVYLIEGSAVRKAVSLPIPARVIASPRPQTIAVGERASFSVVTNGNPAVAFRWQRQAAGVSSWTDVIDGPGYDGSTTAVLTLAAIGSAMNRDFFRCVVTNALGSDTSSAAQLFVDPPIVVVPLRVGPFAGAPYSTQNAPPIDGAGGVARLSSPRKIAADASGNLYVSELGSHSIRKITAGGLVSTLAGNGTAGTVDGVGRAAQFREPESIAVDPLGNVFVAHRPTALDRTTVIRKVTAAGVVTTFARTGPDGALFTAITALACDPAGDLIVASNSTRLIRFSPTGGSSFVAVMSTEPGLGALTRAAALAHDRQGNLYVAATNRTVLKLTPEGVLRHVAGTAEVSGAVDGQGANAQFRLVGGLAVDSRGNVLVADTISHAIRRISVTGVVSTVAGIKPTAAMSEPTGMVDGIGAAVRFYQPSGIVCDRSDNVYIVDSLNNTVRRGVTTQVVAAGERVQFNVLLTGEAESVPPPAGPARARLAESKSFQWLKRGVAVSGATDSDYTIASATATDSGEYSVKVATAEGVSVSEPIFFQVRSTRLSNLSIRGRAGAGSDPLIVGFVIEGSALPLLVRGVGPGLQPFGIAGTLARPRLALYSGGTTIAENTGWDGSPEVAEASARVSAFSLDQGRTDAAIVTTLDPGAFTAQCASVTGEPGAVLLELYDANGAPTAAPHLINMSARGQVGTGADVMIAGFALTGTGPRQLLIRGAGPSLGRFGVAGALADPRLQLFDSGSRLRATNDNWGDDGANSGLETATRNVGAFAFDRGSTDAALLVTLTPGTYTVHLSGVVNTSGVALLELYEAPD